MMDNEVRAQVIDGRNYSDRPRKRFAYWAQDSLLLYPLVFMLAAVLGAYAARNLDLYLATVETIPDWWTISVSAGVTLTSLIAAAMLGLLAIVFSISMVALQLSNQQYSPRVLKVFERSRTTKVVLGLFIATFVYSYMLLLFLLRTSAEEITFVSVFIDILLVFACLIAFVLFMRSILLMIRVNHIITLVADDTERVIAKEQPLAPAYVICQAPSFEPPDKVIRYARPPDNLFMRRHDHGVFTAIERSTLVQIASEHDCVLRVLPRYGSYINGDDAVVEVYGNPTVPSEKVLQALYLDSEPSMTQDPAYGIRILVDVALQALSPAVNAPTTARAVIDRLASLLSTISQRPQPTGVYTDETHQVRLLQPVRTWEYYVELAFCEIIHYGKDDPQTRRSVTDAMNYLQEKVPDRCQPALHRWLEELGSPDST